MLDGSSLGPKPGLKYLYIKFQGHLPVRDISTPDWDFFLHIQATSESAPQCLDRASLVIIADITQASTPRTRTRGEAEPVVRVRVYYHEYEDGGRRLFLKSGFKIVEFVGFKLVHGQGLRRVSTDKILMARPPYPYPYQYPHPTPPVPGTRHKYSQQWLSLGTLMLHRTPQALHVVNESARLHAVPVTGTAVVSTGIQRERPVTQRSVVWANKMSTCRDGRRRLPSLKEHLTIYSETIHKPDHFHWKIWGTLYSQQFFESQCKRIIHEKWSKYFGNMRDSSVSWAKIRRPSTPVDGRDFDGRRLEKPSRYRPVEKLPEPLTERVGYPSYGTRRTGATGTACSPTRAARIKQGCFNQHLVAQPRSVPTDRRHAGISSAGYSAFCLLSWDNLRWEPTITVNRSYMSCEVCKKFLVDEKFLETGSMLKFIDAVEAQARPKHTGERTPPQ
ncbi:hypothetical protein DFH08DRAFT_809287 [Mycena albidolilacea]|uniref:Uncharacterized protein n=1 Tax=Mycena albidolilacea TaxID=1033008 RepID=A0AAD7A1C9_9AGAR|nr:hypothetical protein DFH08DRAFT_809287 [Mycena albidolilacea]